MSERNRQTDIQGQLYTEAKTEGPIETEKDDDTQIQTPQKVVRTKSPKSGHPICLTS